LQSKSFLSIFNNKKRYSKPSLGLTSKNTVIALDVPLELDLKIEREGMHQFFLQKKFMFLIFASILRKI